MKVSIHKQLFLFAFLIIAGNAFLANAVYQSNQKLSVADLWIQHTIQVIDQSKKIYLTSRDIETSYRAYVITRDSAFLGSLDNSSKTIFLYIGQLKQLTKDNYAQQQRAAALVLNLRQLLAFSFNAVALRRERGLIPAVSYISGNEGKHYTAEIRVTSNAIMLSEGRLLAQRKQVYSNDLKIYHRYLLCIFILMACLAVLLLIVTGKYLFQNKEKEKHAAELVIANKELHFQNEEKGKRAFELTIANKELSYQNKEKEKRAAELIIVNRELSYQNTEKENRAAELVVANAELLYQNDEKENRAAELVIANKELLYQNTQKESRAAELIVANKELLYQNTEKECRAAELIIANKELSYQNDEKEKREVERTKMLSDLVARNKDLEQFAYIISHNLRAPIANIIGASNALTDVEMSDEDKEELNSGIGRSILKLDDVVRDLNHILEIKTAISINREPVIFSNLVDEIKTSIQNLIDKFDIEISYDFDEINELLTLKPYLYSIFYNLISNSVKYRQQGIPSLIQIKSSKHDDKITLEFADNGLGIDLEKNHEQIFGLYRRFHTNVEGKGMGLYMVKTQVETLGGNISIQSAVNKGTVFNIEFAA